MAPPRLLLVLVALLGMVQHAETVHTRGVSVHTLIHPSAKLRHHAPQLSADETSSEDAASTNALLANPLLTASGVALGLTSLIHAPTFATFAAQWSAIRDAGVSGDEFWAPLQFWIFFAIGHPLIKPAVAIGEVLHSAPGPLIGLLPATFVAANLAVLALLAAVPKARSAAAVAVVALTVNFVGCGLEGTVNQGDYNLALDDGVKGCPTYEQVRQPSMDSFDIKKYDGRWYEHAFHDWTQFSEVYDTTFDVELSADGTRWLDDFGVRGPSPKAAPISWDKSPVANGAHYFLKATYDPRYFVFRPPTHFSHMSHPTFPTSHLFNLERPASYKSLASASLSQTTLLTSRRAQTASTRRPSSSSASSGAACASLRGSTT